MERREYTRPGTPSTMGKLDRQRTTELKLGFGSVGLSRTRKVSESDTLS